ncbi:MAG: O-antigen ligase family protein [Verrucomicrobiota bacterium]
MRFLVLAIFLLGLLLIGLIGTGTAMLFAWPGYFLVGLSAVVGVFAWRREGGPRANDLCLLSAVLLVGYLVARVLTSPVAYLAREDLLLVFLCLVIYAGVALHFTRTRQRMAIVWVLVLLAMVNFVIGLYHFSGHPEFWIVPGYERSYPEGRVGGLFNNPNHMGAFMCFVALTVLAIVFFARNRITTKMCLVFVSVMAVVGLVMTVSRGSYIGLAVGVVVSGILIMWMFWQWRRRLFFKLLPVVGILGVVALGGVIYLASTFLPQRSGAAEMFVDGGRVSFWKAAVSQFGLNPLVGTGARTYYYYSRQLRSPETEHHLLEIGHAHSDYVELLAEYGVIGVLLLVLFLVVHGIHGLRYLWWYGRQRESGGINMPTRLAMVIGALAAMAAGAVHAMGEFQAHIPAVAMLYAVAMGILANPGFKEIDYRPARLPRVDFLLGFGAMLAGAFFVYQFFFMGMAEYHLEKAIRNQDDQFNLENTEHINKAKKLDPENHRIYFVSGAGWLRGMREDMPRALKESMLRKAAEEFEASRQLFPQDIYVLMALANCLDGLGVHEAAEEHFLEALEWAPTYQSTRLAYAVHLHRMGRYDEAAEGYQLALRANPYASLETSRVEIPQYRRQLEEDRERAAVRQQSENLKRAAGGLQPLSE